MNGRVPLYPMTAAGDSPQGHRPVTVQCWEQGALRRRRDEVAEECAVALVYNGVSHAVMMATPCDLEDLALGFSLSEGILQGPGELRDLVLNERAEGIEIAMTISSRRFAELKQRRRNLTGRTGCGLCGAESLEQAIRPVPGAGKRRPGARHEFKNAAIQRALETLTARQALQGLTGAVHAAAWCERDGHIQLVREDVGRHNALDKLIGVLQRPGGAAAMNPAEGFVLVSSRASYEMVQKASQVGVNLLVALSAPTSLAIQLAREAGMTLIGFARTNRHVIYT
ncbi:formate dehydrogenase accessory sulfurtransferase FdhD [Microbulbifer sp.]|uniref:formate dehydrogenase accessory sulfurtransferase FdhD n=1 Tax=Microbulbifer sp. TaxID=1908541 RepID=UPI003F2E10BC